jgi:hypothetical protein
MEDIVRKETNIQYKVICDSLTIYKDYTLFNPNIVWVEHLEFYLGVMEISFVVIDAIVLEDVLLPLVS